MFTLLFQCFSKHRAKSRLSGFVKMPNVLHTGTSGRLCVHICVCMLTHTTDQSCLWILMQNPSMKYHQIKCSSTLNNYHDEVGYITGMWAWCNTGESSLQKRKLYMVISTGAKNALLKFNIQWYIDWVSGYLTVYICQNSLSFIL